MRPMSCFIEPQAYATFMIPAIFFLLNDKKMIWALIATICILLSTSSLGILMCAVMWLFVLFDSDLSLQIKIGIVVLGIVFLVVALQSNISQFAFNKIKNIDISSDARLSQGFIIYSQMPIGDQVLGIGKRSLVDYILNNNIYVGKWSYVTTIAGFLFYFGLAGIFSFGIFVAGQIKKKDFMIREFIVLLVAISFGQTILFNVYFVLFYVLLFCLDKN